MTLAAAPDLSIAQLYSNYPVTRTAGGTSFINLTDDYIAYLTFANAGMLNKGNLLCFDYAISHLPSANPIVEIGSFCGLSTNLLAHFKQRHNVSNPIFNCDRWEFEGAEGNVGDSQIPHSEYRTFVRDTYMRNVKMFSRDGLPHTIEKLSDDFFVAWSRSERLTDVFNRPAKLGGPISFCYIDGNHSYDYARRDFENADRFLEPGGFILFDDSADGSPWEVCRVIDEVKRMPNYRFVVKNPNYLFQKI
jgi:predicted O-methyltransferase YrrM